MCLREEGDAVRKRRLSLCPGSQDLRRLSGGHIIPAKNWKLLFYRQMLVSDICVTFKATVEQDRATWLLPWREIYISSIYARIIVYYKSCLLHLNWTFKC